MFVTAEFAPGGVEFPGHADKFKRQFPAVGGRYREMVVTPASGGQAFQFEVAEIRQDFAVAARYMAGVVENRHIRVEFPARRGDDPIVVQQGAPRETDAVRFRLGVESLPQHVGDASGAAALSLADDVEENSVRVGKQFHGLFAEGAQDLKVSRIPT